MTELQCQITISQFSHSVMSDSLRPHGLQNARFPCPSPTSRAYSNSCPLSQRCHPTFSFSVVPSSSCLQSFPESGSFPMSQLITSGGQSVRVSASASVLPMNIQDWFPLLTGLISLQPKELSRVFSNTTVQKYQFFSTQVSLQPNFHIHTWLPEKPLTLTRWTFVGKVMSLLFNTWSRLVIAFLPRSKHLLISWLQSWSAVTLEPPTIKSLSLSIVSPFICHEVMGLDALILVFWILSSKPTFSLSSFTFIKRRFSSSSLSSIRVVSSVYLRLLIFLQAILISACASSSLAFHTMYSAYTWKKQGDNIQPWCKPFPIWNQSIVPCPGISVAFWPAYRFLRRQVRWSGIPISWRIFHNLMWSTKALCAVVHGVAKSRTQLSNWTEQSQRL